jgi:CheY-like chemotaxis protein
MGPQIPSPIRIPHSPQYARSERVCLVVHEDPAAVRILARYVEGYRMVGAPSESRVLALVQDLHPRAILTTPERAESVAVALSLTPFDVPIIACALPRAPMPERTDGVLGYLVKPITPELLAHMMSRVEPSDEMVVLLVDDDPDAVRLLESMLSSIPKYQRFLKAYSGDQALRLMQEAVPSIAFLDLLMPEMGGRQVVSRMRADERLRQVPVVIVSAQDDTEAELGLQMEVRWRQPLTMTKAGQMLTTVLESISAHYPPGSEPPGPLAPEPPG